MRRYALVAMCAALLSLSSVYADEPTQFMRLMSASAQPPLGWVEFCSKYPKDCEAGSSLYRPVFLNPERTRELERVNREVNGLYKGRSYESMEYPHGDYSNCVGYALIKRQKLIAAGWPSENVLLALVKGPPEDPFSEIEYRRELSDHMVVVVRTDKGEFVLDNWLHRYRVVLWSETRYRFIGMQAGMITSWVRIEDTRPVPWENKKTDKKMVAN